MKHPRKLPTPDQLCRMSPEERERLKWAYVDAAREVVEDRLSQKGAAAKMQTDPTASLRSGSGECLGLNAGDIRFLLACGINPQVRIWGRLSPAKPTRPARLPDHIRHFALNYEDLKFLRACGILP